MEPPLSLEELRVAEDELRSLCGTLEAKHGKPIYFPLQFSDARPLRGAQGYLTKWPAEAIELFPRLHRALSRKTPSLDSTSSRQVGAEYRKADEAAAVSTSDPFAIDPALKERALRGHAATQNALADHLRSRGFEPRSPGSDDPSFDLAWDEGDVVWVAEVKSMTHSNEEKQLRLGLGQVLRNRHLLSGRYEQVRAMLALESVRVSKNPQPLVSE